MSLPQGRIWRDGAFTLACSLTANGCLLVSSLAAVRHFRAAPGESDHLFLLNSVFVLGALLANMGIPSAATKLMAGGPDGHPGRYGAIAARAVVASTFKLTLSSTVFSLIAIGVFIRFFSHRPLLLRDAAPVCLCILFFAPGKWIGGVLLGLRRLRTAAVYEAGLEALRLVLLLAVLHAGGDAGAVIRAWTGAYALQLIFGLGLLRTALARAEKSATGAGEPSALPAASAASAASAWSLSLSLFLPFAGLFALTHGLTILLAERGQAGDASRWAVGLQIVSILPLIAGPMGTVLLPHFLHRVREGEPGMLLADAKPILAKVGMALLAATVLIFSAAGPLLAFLFPAASSPGTWAVRTLCVLYSLEAFKFALDPLLVATGHWKSLAKLELARLSAALAAGYWAVGAWSLGGAVAAMAVAVAISATGKGFLYRSAADPAAGGRHALG